LALTTSQLKAEFDNQKTAQSLEMIRERYIQPQHGTTAIALMYLPSDTLYMMETIRNRELADWLNQRDIFPVSPNTLRMTLQTIALVHKWYEVASRIEKRTGAGQGAEVI
jgi:DNA recombination protein RmuC